MEYLTIGVLLAGIVTVQAHAQNEAQSITNLLLSNRPEDRAGYAGVYSASVENVTRQQRFNSEVEISAEHQHCTLNTNVISNHDFNGPTANLANNVRELLGTFLDSQKPRKNGKPICAFTT